MTKEEVLKFIEDGRIIPIQIKANDEETSKYNLENLEALNMIIKALGQKSCEDCISRQAVIDSIRNYFHDEYYQRTSIQDCRDCLIEDVIKPLPSVTPQKKTGHWIDTGSGQECSECGEIQYGYDNFRFYCAKCGSKNVIESEV